MTREELGQQLNRELEDLSRVTAVPLRAWLVQHRAITAGELAYAQDVIQRARESLQAVNDGDAAL